MIESIYIARHGFRLNWLTTDWKSVTGLPRDPPLSEYGVAQAEELADYFISLPPQDRPTAIFSSPYYRCLQTSKPVSVALGVPIYAEHGISEWYSPVAQGTGLYPRPASAASLQKYFPEIDPSWSSLWYPSREGEDIDQVHARIAGFLEAFLPVVERGKHTHILLVGHAATVITLARELLGDRSLSLRAGCCSLTEVIRKKGASGWEAVRLAEGGHLKLNVLHDWGFEDVKFENGKVIEDHGEPDSEYAPDEPVGLQFHSSL